MKKYNANTYRIYKEDVLNKVNSLDIGKFTFSNIKKFTKRYDLTFLNRDYFNRLSTKLLLIR